MNTSERDGGASGERDGEASGERDGGVWPGLRLSSFFPGLAMSSTFSTTQQHNLPLQLQRRPECQYSTQLRRERQLHNGKLRTTERRVVVESCPGEEVRRYESVDEDEKDLQAEELPTQDERLSEVCIIPISSLVLHACSTASLLFDLSS
jgi:hypothetical protein